MRDNRVRTIATADQLANAFKRQPIFIFKSDGAKAIYIFGRRIFASKEWNIAVQRGTQE